MNDFALIPLSWLDPKIVSEPDFLKAVIYLAKEIHKNGSVNFSSGDAMKMFSMTKRRYRTFMSLITGNTQTNRHATHQTTNISFACQVVTQPLRQPKRQTAIKKSSRDTLTISAGFPFVDPMFEKAFSTWLEYKEKQYNFKYKTERSLKLAYQELVRLSGCNPCTAMRIVEQSMSNGWKGLFELKMQYGSTTTTAANDHASRAESRRRMSDLASEIVSRDADTIIGLYDGKKQ